MSWIKNRFLADEVGPGARGSWTAGGNIPVHGIVKKSGDDIVVCGVHDLDTIGIVASEVALISTESATVIYSGEAEVIADVAINAGELIKCGTVGTAHPALTLALSGVTIGSSIGSGFTNQPANDGVEIGSDNAADVIPVDIYGTTTGGLTVVKERIVLTGATFVSSVKLDWGVILGMEIPDGYGIALGTITLREASGNATITTMATTVRRKGIVNIALANRRAFNHVVGFTADSTTVKTVGLVGTNSAGTTIYSAVVATSATEVQLAAFRTVTKLLVGDLEVARTGTFKTDLSVDGEAFIIGEARETVAAGAHCTVNKFEQQHGVRNLYTLHTASIAVHTTGSETDYNRKVTIPLSVLAPPRKVRVRYQGIITAADAADNHTAKLTVGSTAVITSTVADATANDIMYGEFEFIPRAAAGATAACVGAGFEAIGVVGTVTAKPVLLASTNFATDGALDVKVTGTPGSAAAGNSSRLDVFVVDLVE